GHSGPPCARWAPPWPNRWPPPAVRDRARRAAWWLFPGVGRSAPGIQCCVLWRLLECIAADRLVSRPTRREAAERSLAADWRICSFVCWKAGVSWMCVTNAYELASLLQAWQCASNGWS
ncbi:unnamed protein product, partial [Amoebophrya sp. A120]